MHYIVESIRTDGWMEFSKIGKVKVNIDTQLFGASGGA